MSDPYQPHPPGIIPTDLAIADCTFPPQQHSNTTTLTLKHPPRWPHASTLTAHTTHHARPATHPSTARLDRLARGRWSSQQVQVWQEWQIRTTRERLLPAWREDASAKVPPPSRSRAQEAPRGLQLQDSMAPPQQRKLVLANGKPNAQSPG